MLLLDHRVSMLLLRDVNYCILSLLNFPLLKYLYIFTVKVRPKSYY